MKSHELGIAPMVTKICAAVALVSLVGCGGSGGNGSSSSSALSSAAPSSTAVSSAALSSVVSSSVAESSSSSVQSSDASSSSSAAPQWELVWSDEFDGTEIDTSKWGFEKNCWGGGNNEQQCYTDRPVNSYVADGVLTIVAQRETFTGPNTPEGDGPGTATLPYTSARLRTKNIQEWTFGRFEIRAKLPAGQGTWPAIWMLPTNSPYGVWASSGEIDIMEAVNLKTVTGNAAPEARVHGTLHYGRTWPGNKSSGAEYTLPGGINPADDFHTYALEWEEGEIRWYVDGVHFATQRDTGWYGQYMQDGELVDAPVGAPFDRHSQFHLLLNLAVGGSWAGNTNNTGIDATVFPQKMLVDFVRVYQCSGSPVDGKGCATIDENAEIVPGNTRPIIGTVEFPGPPLFVMYGDDLTTGLKFNSYDTEKVISYSEIAEAGRGDVLHVVKTGNNGNVYFEVNGDPTNLTNWSGDSELIFDVKVSSKAAGANLLVKIDSGWPNVSDYVVPVGADGEWKEIRITLADLIDNRNSMNGGNGIANLASIKNTFVIDSTGAIDVSFDNVRIEGDEAEVVEEFAPLPLFTIYDNAANAKLMLQKWDNNSGQITFAEVDAEPAHGKVLNIAKTGATGSAFFTVNTHPIPGDFSKWSAKGELVFDYRVNTKGANVKLLVKMDSGWPKVSDVEVDSAADGVWKTFRIDVATLIARGNSIEPGAANIAALTNVFVVEPSGVMNVDVDNIRLVVKEDEAEPTEDMDIFVGGLSADWGNPGFNVWRDGGQVITIDATVNDADKGTVTQVAFTATGMGTFYIQGPAKNLTAFADGNLVFDLKVVSNTGNTSGFLVKADCGYPCAGAEVPVALPSDNNWHTITVPIADINKGGFDITKVDTPFSLWPVFGQQNVTFQVANVRWELAD